MFCDPNFPNEAANLVLSSIKNGIIGAGLDPIERAYVGRGPTPSEDCCPDIVVWVSNFRLYDQASPDTLQENRILAHVGLAFDVNVRVGFKFFEMEQETLMAPDAVTLMSEEGNKYVFVAFTSAVTGLMGDPDIQQNADAITPGTTFDFQDGGCAGTQFPITIGVM